MAVTNQELILGGGVILLILFSMMGKKGDTERILVWQDPRPPDAPEVVEGMSESDAPLKKKKTYDEDMHDRMNALQNALREIVSRTNRLARQLNIVARQTGVVGEGVKMTITGIIKRIDDFMEDVAEFGRTLPPQNAFAAYLAQWTDEALKYHHGLQSILMNSEHYKTRGDIRMSIIEFTRAFLQMHPQKDSGEDYYVDDPETGVRTSRQGGAYGALILDDHRDISESLEDNDFRPGADQFGNFGNGYFANRRKDGDTAENTNPGQVDPDSRAKEANDAHTVADPSSKPGGAKPGPSHNEKNPMDDDNTGFTVTKKNRTPGGMTLELLQQQISKTFDTTNDLTTTNSIIAQARMTGWDPENLSHSQINIIQRAIDARDRSGAYKRPQPDESSEEGVFGGGKREEPSVELDLTKTSFGEHPNQETNTTAEAFGSGGKQSKPVGFGQQYLDAMFPGQQNRISSIEQATKKLAGIRSYLDELMQQSLHNQLLTKQYETQKKFGEEEDARNSTAVVHGQQAELSTLLQGGGKLRHQINAVLDRSIAKLLLNQGLRQGYMQSKRDNTFEIAITYLRKFIEENLEGQDQTSAILIVNEAAAAFCMFRDVYRNVNIGFLVKTGQVKRTKEMEPQAQPDQIPAPPLRRSSPEAPAKKKRRTTAKKGGKG